MSLTDKQRDEMTPRGQRAHGTSRAMDDFRDSNLQPFSNDFARQMHIQRTELIHAYLRSVGGITAACIRPLARACVGLARQVVAWQRLQRDIRALQKLDDRMLADMGVSRYEVEWIARNGRPIRATPHFVPYPRRKTSVAATEQKPGPKTVSLKSYRSA